MGVDLYTYRCRVGSFVSRLSAGDGQKAGDGRGATVRQDADGMLFFVSFSKLIQLIRSLTFIGMWLILAVIVSNLGPPVAKTGINVDSYQCRIGTFIGNRTAGVMTMCMPFYIDFSVVIKFIGTVSFVRLLLIMAGIEQNPGPVYIFRYQYLLVRLGTDVLRRVFDVVVGNNVVQYLNAKSQDIQSLIKAKMITADQKQLLPPINSQPDSSKFDITLLSCLLRNICGLHQPRDPVWMTPAITDTSVEADITRLRMCRNQLMHSDQLVLPEADFNSKWQDLSAILLRLNNVGGIAQLQSDINNAEIMVIDEQLREQFDKTLQEWHESDKLLGQRIDEVVSEVGNVKQNLVGVVSEVGNVKQDLVGVVSEVGNVKQNLVGVVSEVGNVKQDLVGVVSEVGNVKQNLVRVVSEVGNVKQNLVGVVSEVTNVKQDLDGVKRKLEDVELSQQNKVDKSVIQEKLITIYKRDCRLLQVSPFIEDDNEDLISIYQNPTLHHTVYDRDQTKGKQETVYDRNQSKGKQETISSYEEVFCKDDKTFKRVYITGDAGVGKTSLCKRMCLLWSKSRSGDYAGIDESTKRDIKFLEKFDFLFHVSLGATDRRDMIMMIVDQLLYSEIDGVRNHRYKLIESILNQHYSLIVLDGYDEWNPKTSGKHECKTPKGIESEKCVFLTTCRPYKLENVRLSGSDIDHQIEISGIHGLSSEHYVTEVVKYMNEKTHDNKNADQFLEEIKRCKLYDQLCIPMISSHLVVVWWSNQKLTHFSKACLYGKILEMLFKRAERKFDFPSIPPSDINLPKCFSQLDNVNEHVSLLQKVCLLSFNSLFKQDECASTLVFTRKQLMSQPYLFTSDEMDFLCKIGIISKNKVIGCFEDQKQILSLVHKSYIEFFSALYFSSFDACNMMDGVVKNWNSLYDVLQYQNFFQFLAGLSDQKLIFLLENIYSLLSDHLKLWRKYAVVNYKVDYTYSYREQLKLWQTTVINCFIECCRFIDPNVVLKLEDFIFVDISSVDHLKQILLLNTTCVKSIYSVKGKYYEEFDQIQNLQCLHVGDRVSGAGAVLSDYVYDVKFTECMLQNQSTLHTVCFECRDTLIPELPVRSLQHLTSLSLSRVKMSHNSLHNLVTFLSDNVLIENIKLSSVRCDNHPKYDRACTCTLNLPHHTKLTSLCLWCVNILCNHVNNSSLKSITLFTFPGRIVRCYIDVINCIKYSQLEHLDIDGSSMYMLDNNTMRALSHTVNTLPCIKSLTLWYMELPDDVLLQLHPDVTQVKIVLDRVTLSRQCFHCFIESCVNNKSVIRVQLHFCSITSVDGETHSVLSLEESVDYMSEYLTSIPTVNIKPKNDYGLHFDAGSCQ